MLLGELSLVLLWHHERMMAGGREDGSHEGFLHAAHLLDVVLQERLIPDGPGTVEIVGTLGGLILRTAVVVLEARLLGEGLETHTTVLRPMEEGCLIPFSTKNTR